MQQLSTTHPTSGEIVVVVLLLVLLVLVVLVVLVAVLVVVGCCWLLKSLHNLHGYSLGGKGFCQLVINPLDL